jgi:hypothetical protein
MSLFNLFGSNSLAKDEVEIKTTTKKDLVTSTKKKKLPDYKFPKQTKQFKAKKAYLPNVVYSKRYEGLFNNKFASDITIKFEKSGNSLNCHKLVLAASSEYFQGLLKDYKETTILIKDEDETIFTDFVKYIYTGLIFNNTKGCIEYSGDEKIVALVGVLNKVMKKIKPVLC